MNLSFDRSSIHCRIGCIDCWPPYHILRDMHSYSFNLTEIDFPCKMHIWYLIRKSSIVPNKGHICSIRHSNTLDIEIDTESYRDCSYSYRWDMKSWSFDMWDKEKCTVSILWWFSSLWCLKDIARDISLLESINKSCWHTLCIWIWYCCKSCKETGMKRKLYSIRPFLMDIAVSTMKCWSERNIHLNMRCILIHLHTFSMVTCIDHMPYLMRFYKTYRDS